MATGPERDGLSRRDFLNGAALTVAAGLTPLNQVLAQSAALPVGPAAAAAAVPYPPALTGLRGLTDSSFKVAHALAINGQSFSIDQLEPDETYDVVVIGAGLAGLTAAWAYQRRRRRAKILILDNNDDFGGHARRTEHTADGTAGGRLLIGYGGSESMVSPKAKFKGSLGRVLRGLNIAPERFESEQVFHRTLYPKLGLAKSVFFDKETFGTDRLVTGDPLQLGFDEFAPRNPGARPLAQFLSQCPLSDTARTGLVELFEGRRDYMAGQTRAEKLAKLPKISYRQFLTEVCTLPKDAADFFQSRSSDNWGFGIDVLSAFDAFGDGFPGAKALKVADKTAGDAADKSAYVHHFPDGNASLARAMVRQMIPGVAPGKTMDDLVTASFDYSRLDVAGSPVRLRLSATAVLVRNAAAGGAVDIGYVRDGKLSRIRAGKAIVATFASVMPRICPEIPKAAADLMRGNIRSPLVYSKVIVRDWQSFVKLGTHKIAVPNGFHCSVKLDYPVSLGQYRAPKLPTEPIGLHLVHVPMQPAAGSDVRFQAKAGRAGLLTTTFADYEAAIRRDLNRMLAPGGFDASRDITAITVNRWSHGYSYTPNSLFDDVEGLVPQQKTMKARIGNIVFASSDTAWDAYAHAAMAEGLRAVDELTREASPARRRRR
jgi:spermidine dehydrogenase